MRLEGSCHCGAVKFSFVSHTPYPVNRCYCSVCRKMAGSGGYTINIMGEYDTLKIEGDGEKYMKVYRHGNNHRGAYEDDGLGASRRSFCTECSTALWNWNPQHGQWFYPFAGVIDTPLPVPPEQNHILLAYKPGWVIIPPASDTNKHFDGYPAEGIEDWHKARGLYDESTE